MPNISNDSKSNIKCTIPGSDITISGQVQFYWTNALPTEELDIEVLISGLQPTLATVERLFQCYINSTSQMEVMNNLGVIALPLSNIDQTSQSSVSLVVDSEEPEILEVEAED